MRILKIFQAVKIKEKPVNFYTKSQIKKVDFNDAKEEVDILRRLSCRYVVKNYEIFETPNQTIKIMEFLPKASLFENLESLDLDTIWKYFRNIISAVEFCKND